MFSQLLEIHGALAVTLQDAGDQPIYEPKLNATPIWDDVIVIGLFGEDQDVHKIVALILEQLPTLRYEVKQVADQEWERSWMQDFLPMQFGQRLWIIPSYHSENAKPGQVILDPGLAFGTGKHPTTRLCLQWLDQSIRGNEVMIDYGCGSGILAIAALKLGAERVYAIDHDPQAIKATHENAQRNHINTERLLTLYPEDINRTEVPPCNILMANILANPLIDLAPTFNNLVNKMGHLVLSGILATQKEDVIKAYQPWFVLQQCVQEEDWVRLDFSK